MGWGKTFWRISCFFYENGLNSETKSQKIDPKVRNGTSLRGLQTGHWQNWGSFLAKKTVIGQTFKQPFLHNSGWDQVRCHCGSFFNGPDGPTKSHWRRSKIKDTYNSKVTQAGKGEKPGCAGFLAKRKFIGQTLKRLFLCNSGRDQVRRHCGSFFWRPRRSHQVWLTTVQN